MHFGRASLLKLMPFVAVGALVGVVAMRAAHGTSMRGVILLLAMAILLALVAGVIWVFAVHNRRVAVAGDVQKRDALDFAPVAGKGVLYPYRSQYVAMLAGFDVVLDGRFIGQTRGYRFYRLVLEPGRHVLSGGRFCAGDLAFDIHAGQVLYVEQEVQLGSVFNRYHYLLREGTSTVQKTIHGLKMLLPVQD